MKARGPGWLSPLRAVLRRLGGRRAIQGAATDPNAAIRPEDTPQSSALESEERGDFDADWYLTAHPDVAAAGLDPFQHWLEYGKAEGREINAKARASQVGEESLPRATSMADFLALEGKTRRRHGLRGHLVVSLTSYSKRFPTLELTLLRILQQTVQPDETVLWISADDHPHLPQGVLALKQFGLTIRETRDLGAYTKIIPALKAYPNSFIITLDDDIAYPLDTIEPLVAGYRGASEILCRRAHQITCDDTGLQKPYSQWQFDTALEVGADLFATGVGGVLYPPRSLAPQVLDEASFMRLAPKTDDLWLFWMARVAGSPVRRVGPRYGLQPWPGTQEYGLWVSHNAGGGNDTAIANLNGRFGPSNRRD